MQESLQLFTATSGKPSARVLLNDDTTRHLHSTVNPEAEADYFSDTSFWGNTLIFAGIGLGYHLQKIVDGIPPSAQLVIIDYYEKCIDFVMSTTFANISNPLFHISASNYQEKKTDLIELINYIPSCLIQTIRHPASYDIHPGFYHELCKLILCVAPKPQIKKSAAKKALLFYDNFFLQEECKRALQEINGCAPILFKTGNLTSGIEYETELQKAIQREKPDYILSINMKGFDGKGILSNTALYFDIPVIIWYVDDPHPILLSHQKYLHNRITALCWEKSYIPFLQKLDFNDVSYLPLATDPTLFSSQGLPSPSIDFGFVGSAMGGDYLTNIQKKFLWSDALITIADRSSDILLENPERRISKIIQQASNELSIPIPFSDDRNITWLCSYIIHTASMKKRKIIVTTSIPLGLELFGDPEGWGGLLGNNIIVHPNLDYNTQLCPTYRNIAVNLNITSCQMPSAVNQRVFDIPLAGSFVLSDNQSDLSDLFDLGKEAITYKDRNELKDLVKYYTVNSTARHTIIEAAQKRILHEHTYYHRVKYIQQTLNL